jgi:Protein of unknown function (DUF1569)
MELENLFDADTKAEIISRISSLTPQSKPLWGKMNAAQMLAHCQKPLGVALGDHQVKSSFFMRLIGPLFKKQLFNDKPFKRNLPTDKSFIIADERALEEEKQKLSSMVNRFTESNLSDAPHPFFGKLTNEQWSKGTWKHLDHHLQQFGV